MEKTKYASTTEQARGECKVGKQPDLVMIIISFWSQVLRNKQQQHNILYMKEEEEEEEHNMKYMKHEEQREEDPEPVHVQYPQMEPQHQY